MSEIEKQLLENLLDALDRLFDSESSAVDIHSLLYASSSFNGGAIRSLKLDQYIASLGVLIRNSESAEDQRNEALSITNNLRIEVNELL